MRKFTFFCAFFWGLLLQAQEKINVQIYGHLDYDLNRYPDANDPRNSSLGGFTLGEHDFFVTSKLTDRISFLGETVITGSRNSSTGFAASIERARLRINYFGNHSVLIGKMHTAINYWNDVYHHGRIFFPTIDRPFSFNYYVPIHALGIRAQGQNLGELKFGYDLQLANSLESLDALGSNSLNFNYNVSFHIKPIEGSRIMVGFNNDFLPTNKPGPHAHSGGVHHDHSMMYKGSVKLNQLHVSLAYFGSKWEFLNEFAYVQSQTDSLGAANSLMNFTYFGYRIKDNWIPYLFSDFIAMSENELHHMPVSGLKYGIGVRYDISDNVNVKVQYESYNGIPSGGRVMGIEDKQEIKIQLAYAL